MQYFYTVVLVFLLKVPVCRILAYLWAEIEQYIHSYVLLVYSHMKLRICCVLLTFKNAFVLRKKSSCVLTVMCAVGICALPADVTGKQKKSGGDRKH